MSICPYDLKKCNERSEYDEDRHESYTDCRYGSWGDMYDASFMPCSRRYVIKDGKTIYNPDPVKLEKKLMKKLQKKMPNRMMNEPTDRKKSKSIKPKRKTCRCK